METKFEFKNSEELEEVFRVLPVYAKISSERKKNALLILQEWVENELKSLDK